MSDVELYKDQFWLFFTEGWISLESNPYLDFGATDGRECLGRVDFWTTLDFFANVESGRIVLPAPKSTPRRDSAGWESADFDSMPWAEGFDFSVERRGSTEASDYLLECNGIRISATVEPHLNESHAPQQFGVNPIEMARMSLGSK